MTGNTSMLEQDSLVFQVDDSVPDPPLSDGPQWETISRR